MLLHLDIRGIKLEHRLANHGRFRIFLTIEHRYIEKIKNVKKEGSNENKEFIHEKIWTFRTISYVDPIDVLFLHLVSKIAVAKEKQY